MNNNFLEAFESANTLQEDFLGIGKAVGNAVNTAKANIQVNQQNKANAEKQNAANVNDDAANENGYQQIIADLQKIANEQVQFDKKSIDAFIEKINNLKSLDDKSKKQINQMLNQQKAALQQQKTAKANAKGEGQNNTTGTNPPPEGGTSGTVQPSSDVEKTVMTQLNRQITSNKDQVNIDNLIAYLQNLKQQS